MPDPHLVLPTTKNTYSDARIRISPKNVTQQASVWYVARTSDVGDLFHLRKLRRETSMHTYDLVINHRTTRQTVEGIAKLLPHFDRKPTSALIVEAIDSIDSSTFMVASQQKEVFRVLNFVGKQQTDNF